MKRLILILSVALFLSCSNDDNSNDDSSCNCQKLYQARTIVFNPSTGDVISNSGWYPMGIGSESTNISDCSRNGDVVFTFTQNTSNSITDFRHILDCK